MVSDMTNEEIVKALREHAEWWALADEWETPITLGDDLSAAADLIENQQNHIRALLQANDALRPAWISVAERLPEDGAKLLLYVPKTEKGRQFGIFTGELKSVKANDGSGNFWSMPTPSSDWTLWGWSYFEKPNVTHWMPLPEFGGYAAAPEVK